MHSNCYEGEWKVSLKSTEMELWLLPAIDPTPLEWLRLLPPCFDPPIQIISFPCWLDTQSHSYPASVRDDENQAHNFFLHLNKQLTSSRDLSGMLRWTGDEDVLSKDVNSSICALGQASNTLDNAPRAIAPNCSKSITLDNCTWAIP